MDIDKLIERLHNAAGGPEGIRMCQDAATALSMLQAEVEMWKRRCKESVSHASELDIALYDLHAELEQTKAERDAAIKTIFQWTGCPECKYWDSEDEWCEKHDREANSCGGCGSPEWRGTQKED